MATRTISTKLAVEGESEYKQAIANCHSELATLKSRLELVDSEFKGNANSMEALTAKGEVLTSMHEAQTKKVDTLKEALENAKKAQENYAQRVADAKENIEKYETALGELKESTGDTSKEQEELTKKLNEWKDELEKAQSYEAAAERSVQSWEKQLNYAQVALNDLSGEIEKNDGYLDEAAGHADGCADSIDEYGNATKDAGKETSTFASVLGAGIVQDGLKTIESYATAAAKALLSLGQDVADAKATIVKMTGATEEALDDLTESMKKVYAQVDDTDIQHTAQAIGEVNTRLGLTGQELEEVSYLFMEFSDNTETEIVAAVDGVVDIMKQWGVETSETGLLLDKLTYAAQASGTSITNLTGYLSSNKAILNDLGYSLNDSIALLAMFAQEGLNTSSIMTGFRTAINNITDAGGDAEKEIKNIIKQIASMGSASEATALAVDTFGSRAGAALADAIRSGRFEIDDWVEAIDGAGGTLLTTADAADTMEDKWNQAINSMKADLSGYTDELYELGLSVLPIVQSALEFIADHAPLVASGITGMTTAIVSYKIAVGIATVATEVFGVALSAATMGIGLIVGAIAGVVTAVATFAVTSGSAEDAVKNLTEAARTMESTLESSKDTFQTTTGEVEAATNVANTYIDKLEQMGDYAGLAADEQREYHNILALLCETVPALAEQIDLENNTIEGGTEALRENTEAWKQNALAQAYQEEYNEIIAAYSDVLLEAEENSIRLTEAEAERDAAAENYNSTLAELNELTRQAEEAYEGFDVVVYPERYTELQIALAGYHEEMEQASIKVNNLTKAIQSDEEAVAEAEEAMGLAEQAIKNLTGAEEENQPQTEEMTAKVQEMTSKTEDLITQVEELETAYNESYDAAYDSINKQIGLFEDMDGSAKTSIGSLIDTLDGQIEYMNTYAANIQKAMELGVDQGLIEKLSDGSEESAQILAAIVQGGEEDIAKLNEKLAQVEEGKANFSGTVADMETEFSEKMDALVGELEDTIQEMDMSTDAYNVGIDNIRGLINGAESQRSALVNKYKSIAQSALSAYKGVMSQASPSKKMAEAGKFDIQGLIQGAESEKENLAAAYEDVANTALESMRKSMPSVIEEPKRAAVPDTAQALSTVLDRMEAVGNQNTPGETIQVTIPLTVDGDVLGKAVTKFQTRKARAEGK